MDLETARRQTRKLAYGDIVGAVFPITVGHRPAEKAWYRVASLRPLLVEWMPYTDYEVDRSVLESLDKAAIYRLIEADI